MLCLLFSFSILFGLVHSFNVKTSIHAKLMTKPITHSSLSKLSRNLHKTNVYMMSSNSNIDTTNYNNSNNKNNNNKNSSSSSSSNNTIIKDSMIKIGGLLSLLAIDNTGKKLFNYYNIAFPSSLGMMILSFMSMLSIEKISSKNAKIINNFFLPVVSNLKIWMPLFFVPPLVVLPLKYHLISDNLLRLTLLIVIGMIFSTITTGIVGNTIKSSDPNPNHTSTPTETDTKVSSVDDIGSELGLSSSPTLPSPLLPLIITITTLLLSKIIGNTSNLCKLYGISSTTTSYLIASSVLVPSFIKSIIHPVLGCTIITSGFLSLYNNVIINGNYNTYLSLLSSYFSSGSSGSSLIGAGNIIASFLGPVIISFGFQLYAYRKLLLRNIIRVVSTTLFSAFIGLFSSAFLSKMFKLSPIEAALAPLTRCITTPLALSGATLIGADPSLAAFIVAPTGILGASFGEKLLKKFQINDDFSVGMAIGAASHGIGAASLSSKPIRFAAAVVSMTLTGLWTVGLLATPAIRGMLLKIVGPEIQIL